MRRRARRSSCFSPRALASPKRQQASTTTTAIRGLSVTRSSRPATSSARDRSRAPTRAALVECARARRGPRPRRHPVRAGRAGRLPAVYDKTWGRFKAITHPTPGNHEYSTPRAAGLLRVLRGRALVQLRRRRLARDLAQLELPQRRRLRAPDRRRSGGCRPTWPPTRPSARWRSGITRAGRPGLHGSDPGYDAFWADAGRGRRRRRARAATTITTSGSHPTAASASSWRAPAAARCTRSATGRSAARSSTTTPTACSSSRCGRRVTSGSSCAAGSSKFTDSGHAECSVSPDDVTSDEAAAVFRRAAELDQRRTHTRAGRSTSPRSSRPGIEAGLSRDAIRQALAEVRGRYARAPAASRRGRRPHADIDRPTRSTRAVDKFMREQQFRWCAGSRTARSGRRDAASARRCVAVARLQPQDRVARGRRGDDLRRRACPASAVEPRALRARHSAACVGAGTRSRSRSAPSASSAWPPLPCSAPRPRSSLAAPGAVAVTGGAFAGARAGYRGSLRRSPPPSSASSTCSAAAVAGEVGDGHRHGLGAVEDGVVGGRRWRRTRRTRAGGSRPGSSRGRASGGSWASPARRWPCRSSRRSLAGAGVDEHAAERLGVGPVQRASCARRRSSRSSAGSSLDLVRAPVASAPASKHL